MEGIGHKPGSNTSAARIFELPGEPAIVINGVPEITSSNSNTAVCNASSVIETQRKSGFGEWLEGRQVQKWFLGRYYLGVVTEYDKYTGWYRVYYEDGDSEDLDWKELEGILLPLDVTVSLKTMAQRIVRKNKKSAHKPGKSVAHSQNPQIKSKATKGKKTILPQEG